MIKSVLSINQTLSALRFSVAEGVFAQAYAILTGSVFLPAFALALNASPVQVGILAAIPFFANTAQFFGAFLVEKYQRRKRLAVLFAFFSRLMWAPIIILSVILAGEQPGILLTILIGLVFISALLGALSGVSWLSWMAGLVPDEIRGRFFGLRNSILSAVTITVTLVGSRFLDKFMEWWPGVSRLHAFEILFGVAVVAGMFSAWLLTKKPELPVPPLPALQFRKLYRIPLKDRNFRRLLRFAVLRSFATNIAAPFFIVYMLEDLKISYSVIGLYTVLTSVADLLGMWIWGHLSDHIGNRPVIIIVALVTTFLPCGWLLTGPDDLSIFLLIPLFNLTGGFMWAGYNLCSVNLLFRMAPEAGNSIYFAYWSVFNGLAAGLGALAGGVIAKNVHWFAQLMPFSLSYSYQWLFLISSVLRLFPLLLVRRIREEGGLPMVKAIGVLRNVKAWGSLMGFNAPLHFFLPNRANHHQPSPYWPIWRSVKDPAASDGNA